MRDNLRKQSIEVHSHTVEHRGKVNLGPQKKVSERKALTSWRAQRDENIKTAQESQQERGSYRLRRTGRGTHQDSERAASEVHPRTREYRGRVKSGQ
jgi:hypothetical protein